MSIKKYVVDLIYDNSLDIYDALESNRLDVNKLYDYIINGDKEKIKKIKKVNDRSRKRLINKCSKYAFLDELLSYFDGSFTHIKEIKGVVNIDNFINYILGDSDTFLDKVKIHYANLVFDLILDSNYDYDDIKLISMYKEELINYERKINSKIIKKINEYYIKKITI